MRRLVIGKDWGLYVWNADVAQHTTFMIPREHSRRERHRSLCPTKSFAWRQLGVCFIVSYHYLFYQMPDILGTALQIQISSNSMFVLQLQSITTTCCNESSQYYFHIPQIAALEAFLRFEELCRTMDPWKCWHRRAFLCCMFTLCNITVCFTYIYPDILSSLKDK